MKGNSQSEAFWHKNNFIPKGIESDNSQGTIVVMEKQLK